MGRNHSFHWKRLQYNKWEHIDSELWTLDSPSLLKFLLKLYVIENLILLYKCIFSLEVLLEVFELVIYFHLDNCFSIKPTFYIGSQYNLQRQTVVSVTEIVTALYCACFVLNTGKKFQTLRHTCKRVTHDCYKIVVRRFVFIKTVLKVNYMFDKTHWLTNIDY